MGGVDDGTREMDVDDDARDDDDDDVVDVCVVGAGPTGLALATFLRHRGASCVALEREKTPSEHPRAHFVNTKGGERFDGVGGLRASGGGAIAAVARVAVVSVRDVVGEWGDVRDGGSVRRCGESDEEWSPWAPDHATCRNILRRTMVEARRRAGRRSWRTRGW